MGQEHQTKDKSLPGRSASKAGPFASSLPTAAYLLSLAALTPTDFFSIHLDSSLINANLGGEKKKEPSGF